jgi:hypothetical protein
MNAARQKKLELRNKERADRRASGETRREPRSVRQERILTDLRIQVMTLKQQLEVALGTVRTQEQALDSMLVERAMTAGVWRDLAVQLRDYGIIFSVNYGRVTVSEVNWVAWPLSTSRRPVIQNDIVSGRQRQIVLDEDA